MGIKFSTVQHKALREIENAYHGTNAMEYTALPRTINALLKKDLIFEVASRFGGYGLTRKGYLTLEKMDNIISPENGKKFDEYFQKYPSGSFVSKTPWPLRKPWPYRLERSTGDNRLIHPWFERVART